MLNAIKNKKLLKLKNKNSQQAIILAASVATLVASGETEGDGNTAGTLIISGTATQGETLIATVADADGLGGTSVAYQWQRDGVDIAGAIGNQYKLEQADVGAELTANVAYIDAENNNESVTSAQTVAIANVNDVGSVSIGGTASKGETLTATVLDIDGLSGVTISYQWQRDGVDISGATSDTYQLVQDDVGAEIKVEASYTDEFSEDEAPVSDVTGVVTETNNVGAVTISGTEEQGEVLTATVTDADGTTGVTVSYQWQIDGVDIAGANEATYTLVQADVDGVVSVDATYTDEEGVDESISSADTGSIENVNDAGVVSSFTGTAIQGGSVAVGITDADGLNGVTINYQWQSDDVDIAGATDATYVLTQAEVGKSLKALVSYTDEGGEDESLVSGTVPNVGNVNDVGVVSIGGTVEEGETLTAAVTDIDGLSGVTISYQWQRDGVDVSGADSITHELTQDDVGKEITVQAVYTDEFGEDEDITSAATDDVANVNVEGELTLSGTAKEGESLSANLSDVDGLSNATFSYQWFKDDAEISGATSASYLLEAGDVGASFKVNVTYTDDQGSSEDLTSEDSAAVVVGNQEGVVTISGTATQGETLTANVTDVDGLVGVTIGYQWQRDGVDVQGGTNATHVLSQDDVGKGMSVQVTYTDEDGEDEDVTSATTADVVNVNDPLVGNVTISGSFMVGETLTASNDISDVDGLGSGIVYQWQKDGSDIGGATGATYELLVGDVGAEISVEASYTDGGNTPESTTSTGSVVAAASLTQVGASVNLSSLASNAGARFDGEVADDESGAAVSNIGDVNGDGYDDFIIGAAQAPNVSFSVGKSYVIFGTDDFSSRLTSDVFEMSSFTGSGGEMGYSITGLASSGNLGIRVGSAGDFNGDGYDDIILAAPGADLDSPTFNTGSVYVVYGSANNGESLDLSTLTGANGFRLDGGDATANVRIGDGGVDGIGDVNGDGFDDIIIGAPYGPTGQSHIVFGNDSGFAATQDITDVSYRLIGGATDQLGSVAAAGDVNGDGFADYIVGASKADNGGGASSGSAYIMFGNGSLDVGGGINTVVTSMNGFNGFRIDGDSANSRLGFSVSSAGDINGDGYDDVIIGAYGENGNNGASYVVYGKDSFVGNATFGVSTLDGTNGFKVVAAGVDDELGYSVSAAGDVNGDGYDDLLIGSYQADPGAQPSNSGSSYIIVWRRAYDRS